MEWSKFAVNVQVLSCSFVQEAKIIQNFSMQKADVFSYCLRATPIMNNFVSGA